MKSTVCQLGPLLSSAPVAHPLQDYAGNTDSFLDLDLQYVVLGVDLQVREDSRAYLPRFGDAESYEPKPGDRSWG